MYMLGKRSVEVRTSSRFNKTRLLSAVCLLFLTAGITMAQSAPELRINDISMYEGDIDLFGTDVEIDLSKPSPNTVSVLLSTQPGTALSNIDFGAGSALITFQPGQTKVLVQVYAIGDTLVEGTEQFFLNLSNPVNATIADAQGVATIIDDDALLLLTKPSSNHAAGINSPLFTDEAFPIFDNLNFSSDNRGRISVFAIGLKLSAGEPTSAVTATAEDSQGIVRPLSVEFVGKVPNFFWLSQVVLKLNDQPTSGDIKIRVSLHGATSNMVVASVKPQ